MRDNDYEDNNNGDDYEKKIKTTMTIYSADDIVVEKTKRNPMSEI